MTLKENPVPITKPGTKQINQGNRSTGMEEDIPSSSTNMMDTYEHSNDSSMNVNGTTSNVSKTTERLNQLDTSIIANPDIRKQKQNNRKGKNKEIEELAKVINLPSEEKENKKKQKVIKQVQMMQGKESYNINEDIFSQNANITFGQLIDVSPKLRTELSKGMKLTAISDKNIITSFNTKNVAMVHGMIDDVIGTIFIDSCASINVITSVFLNKLPKKLSLGIIRETIHQVTSEVELKTDIVELEVNLNGYIIKDKFRVVDSDQDIFDIIIGFNTMLEHHLFVNPTNKYLCKIMEEDNKWILISPLINSYFKQDQEIELLYCSVSSIKDYIPDNKYSYFVNICKGLDKSVSDKVMSLFQSFSSIMATSMDDLEKSKLMEHRIVLNENVKPIKQRMYKLAKVQAGILKEELQKLIDNKLIEPSSSSWSSPVLLVPKKNGKWRMCVDYRKLNECTLKDSYSLPFIDEILFSVGKEVKVFSSIDLFSGYHQISMYPGDKDKTCFTTMYGNYNFCVMPFGLCNAPATFQREMNRIFFNLLGKCLFVYIDDLIVFSNSLEQHINDLKEVFQIVKENKLKLNLGKCNFFQSKVEILGHELSTKGISPMNKKVEVINNWLPPSNITEVRSFLGAIGYYRKFIANFATIAQPLFNLTKTGIKFEWSERANESFKSLKEKMINAPILQLPNFNIPFIIRTDASTEGIGGALLQTDDDKLEHPIMFVSRTLTKSEKNYSITDLEGTAVYYCVKKFKPYITGNNYNTILYTDHRPLIGLFGNKEPNNARQTRWVLTLSMLKVDVKYEPGKKNVLADALSRLHTNKNEIINVISNSNQTNDPIKQFLEKSFVNIDNEKYLKTNGELRKVIQSNEEKIKLILDAHCIGHEGTEKTYERLKRKYYWKNMIKDIYIFVKTCHQCQLFRPKPVNLHNESIRSEPGKPFTTVGLDIVGPLPITKRGNRFIIVLVDYCTKWVEAEPTINVESSDVKRFLTNVFSRHGIPEVLITDNGPQFTSDETKGFLDLYNVYVRFSTTYHPETNGAVENRNKEIGKYLRLLSTENSDWDDILPNALWALRTVKHKTNQFSSFELLYGRRDLQPFELACKTESRKVRVDPTEELIDRFINHGKWIKEATENVRKANKLWEDRRIQKKRMKRQYKPGDLILVRIVSRKKLEPYFYGPLKVIKTEMNTVTVCDPLTGEIADRNIHLKNIVPYYVIPTKTSRDEV